MTVDQHMFCKHVIMDAQDEMRDQLRHDANAQRMVAKLERVLEIFCHLTTIRQCCDGAEVPQK